jgi:ABC-2 type transport system ATP-binding protein
MIDVQHLTKRYGDFTAVDDISFQARPGEILGFLGPNGAGKTTTLRVLTGYMPPTSGTVIVAGHDVEVESLPARAAVGYLPESVPLYPDMTVRGYLDFVADLRRIPSRRVRVMEMIARVGLEARADSLIRNLSRGMRQRVGLAQALVHDPPVLILDEPTVGLDPHQVVEVRELVGALGQDRTVMLSTHILSEAEQVCDRVLIIQQGRIVAEGQPDTLRDQLQRGARILLRLEDAPDAPTVIRLLREVPGVAAVEATPEGFLVEQARGVDARGALSAAAIRAGWSVIELRPAAGSLEDVFLEVTSADVTGPGVKKAAKKASRGKPKPRKERR